MEGRKWKQNGSILMVVACLEEAKLSTGTGALGGGGLAMWGTEAK